MTTLASGALAAIVLVHGGFVDGSGWEDVYKILKKDGYTVSIVQNGTVTLADDVATTKRVIDEQLPPDRVTAEYRQLPRGVAGFPRVRGYLLICSNAPTQFSTW